MSKPQLIAAVAVGIAIGVCGQQLLPRPAHAEGGKKYMVRGASASIGGYERDLNALTADGWIFVGTLPQGNGNPALIFER